MTPPHPNNRPPLARMLQIHDAVQHTAKITVTDLAGILEISERTVLRDVRFMRDRLKLPLDFDRKSNTWHYTRPVESFPTVQATEGELMAMLVGSKALEQYRGTPFHAQLEIAFQKLTAGMQDVISFSPTNDLQSISFKNIGVGKTDLALFETLSRAVTRQFELTFLYRKPGDTVARPRHVQPYHLANRENLWYLVGFDHERKALRTFALPRITTPEVRAVKFERPKDFSAEKYFANALGVYGGDGDYRIVIRFRGASADRIRERIWHDSQVIRELPDGRIELEMRLGALPEVERWVLTWGVDAEAMEPKELRDGIKSVADGLRRIYA